MQTSSHYLILIFCSISAASSLLWAGQTSGSAEPTIPFSLPAGFDQVKTGTVTPTGANDYYYAVQSGNSTGNSPFDLKTARFVDLAHYAQMSDGYNQLNLDLKAGWIETTTVSGQSAKMQVATFQQKASILGTLMGVAGVASYDLNGNVMNQPNDPRGTFQAVATGSVAKNAKCLSIAEMGAVVARSMGLTSEVIGSIWNDPQGGLGAHASVLIRDPSHSNQFLHINYGQVTPITASSLADAARQAAGSLGFNTSVTIADPYGGSIALPTLSGKIINAIGFNTQGDALEMKSDMDGGGVVLRTVTHGARLFLFNMMAQGEGSMQGAGVGLGNAYAAVIASPNGASQQTYFVGGLKDYTECHPNRDLTLSAYGQATVQAGLNIFSAEQAQKGWAANALAEVDLTARESIKPNLSLVGELRVQPQVASNNHTITLETVPYTGLEYSLSQGQIKIDGGLTRDILSHSSVGLLDLQLKKAMSGTSDLVGDLRYTSHETGYRASGGDFFIGVDTHPNGGQWSLTGGYGTLDGPLAKRQGGSAQFDSIFDPGSARRAHLSLALDAHFGGAHRSPAGEPFSRNEKNREVIGHVVATSSGQKEVVDRVVEKTLTGQRSTDFDETGNVKRVQIVDKNKARFEVICKDGVAVRRITYPKSGPAAVETARLDAVQSLCTK